MTGVLTPNIMNDVRENAVSSTVDWLSFTVAWERVRKNDWLTHDGQEIACRRLLETDKTFKRDIPLHGYEDCWLSSDLGNARCMVSRPGHSMGIHVQLPGQALAAIGVAKALRICRELGGSVSRIDIASDCKGQSEASDVYGAHISKSMITRAQKVNMVIGTEGNTVYVGSRTSERFLRVYDKAAQMGLKGENWTRIEMECKGERAKWIASYVQDAGVDCIGGLIRDFVSCPMVDWYEDALTRVGVDIGPPQPKKMTDTRKWLMTTVAKTLAKETRDDAGFLIDFLRHVQVLREDGSTED